MRDGGRVRDPDHPERWWYYRDLDWYARATSGMDFAGHPLLAEINDGKLLVRHFGDGRMIGAWFTLDELNRVGGRWGDGDPVLRWCDEIDRRGARR